MRARMGIWLCVLSLFSAAVTTAEVDPEHARLAAMCGTWNIEMSLWIKPDAPPLTVKGTSTIKPFFDGMFIAEEIEAEVNGTPVTTMAWTGYNPATKQYEATRISSTNPGQIRETGTYDDVSNRYELKAAFDMMGSTWHQRTVIQPMADSMVATSYLSFGDVPEWKGVEIRYRRVAEH